MSEELIIINHKVLNNNGVQFIFLAPGATLSKGLNRGFATLFAGALGVGAQHLAILCGDKGEPIVLGILVFIIGIKKINHFNT